MKLIVPLLAAAACVFATSAAWSNGDRLEDYGVSPVQPCPPVDHPPNAADAARLIVCAGSYDNFSHGSVYRTFDVHVEVGKARAYTYGDPGGNDINPSAEVYPIRGGKSDAICSPVSDYMQNAGKNCSIFTSTGTGICYKTPFGDWKCNLNQERRDARHNAPPPG